LFSVTEWLLRDGKQLSVIETIGKLNSIIPMKQLPGLQPGYLIADCQIA
jgi:hypothetical protein